VSPELSPRIKEFYQGRHCLITGGLGFIGSTLTIALADVGADVTVVDNMLADHGGNLFNVQPCRNRIAINFGDILSESAMKYLVQGQECIFHLAGQVSHVLSMSNPFPDLDINIKGTAVLMEAIKQHARNAIVVYTGTRGQYGSSVKLPVNEDAPMNPKGIHEITNLTAEKIIQVYGQNFGIRPVLLRLTNIYGPRAQMRHSHYGVANWFVRQILDGKPVKVFGDGSILRDFVYVDDVTTACLLSGATPAAYGMTFNIGDDHPVSFLQLVQTMIRVAGEGSYEFAEFTPERKAQEPGDYYSDITRARRILGWSPATPLEKGLAKTFAYYREHRAHYWDSPQSVTDFRAPQWRTSPAGESTARGN
jgi:UDP-glucose 4-epimerase